MRERGEVCRRECVETHRSDGNEGKTTERCWERKGACYHLHLYQMRRKNPSPPCLERLQMP